MDDRILSTLVKVGKVSSVDAGKRKARVTFEAENDMVSGWLIVIQHYDADIYIEPDGGHGHTDSMGGACSEQPNHDHTRSNVTYWMPKVGDTVLCLFLPVPGGDGFILGGV